MNNEIPRDPGNEKNEQFNKSPLPKATGQSKIIVFINADQVKKLDEQRVLGIRSQMEDIKNYIKETEKDEQLLDRILFGARLQEEQERRKQQRKDPNRYPKS